MSEEITIKHIDTDEDIQISFTNDTESAAIVVGTYEVSVSVDNDGLYVTVIPDSNPHGDGIDVDPVLRCRFPYPK